ncbi:hypothetical protein METSCH_B04730 [Metschnikowia aff. pulcherrima]|uniref:Uncharacterized protein n=1 Tax=Metschnikowia aff. pulcherrima TaxID=2163413 RepID=A0A4V1ADX9_9ASCO|nr:hypothetical protein METSCH_B04730 [Metschnikowia aff. pulcherrima]
MAENADLNTPELNEKDKPTQEQMHSLQTTVQQLLNPNGENNQINEYINNTFSYVLSMLDKVANAKDKDAAAEEIAQDLKSKYEGWAQTKLDEREGEKKKSLKEGENRL